MLDGLLVRSAPLGVTLTLAVAVTGAALCPGQSLAGPIWAQVTLDRYFRLEWDPPSDAQAPVIAGSVTNLGRGPAQRMQLAVERPDSRWRGGRHVRLPQLKRSPDSLTPLTRWARFVPCARLAA